MNETDRQMWLDLGFIIAAAQNWADLLVRMSSVDFAPDATDFEKRVKLAADRIVATLKQGTEDAV